MVAVSWLGGPATPVPGDVYDSPLLPLPGALLEASGLRERCERLGAKIPSQRYLTEERATKGAVLAQLSDSTLLHISTHSCWLTPHRDSGLVLKSGTTEEGVLSMRDVSRTRLSARLAVLSACDTTRGLERPGEGEMGLPWYFLSAGCSSVIVTDWAIRDSSSVELMSEFYGRLLDPQRTKSVTICLAEAMRARMRDPAGGYRHPYFWAAYMLFGDGR